MSGTHNASVSPSFAIQSRQLFAVCASLSKPSLKFGCVSLVISRISCLTLVRNVLRSSLCSSSLEFDHYPIALGKKKRQKKVIALKLEKKSKWRERVRRNLGGGEGERKVRRELRNGETGDDSEEVGIERTRWWGEPRMGLLIF